MTLTKLSRPIAWQDDLQWLPLLAEHWGCKAKSRLLSVTIEIKWSHPSHKLQDTSTNRQSGPLAILHLAATWGSFYVFNAIWRKKGPSLVQNRARTINGESSDYSKSGLLADERFGSFCASFVLFGGLFPMDLLWLFAGGISSHSKPVALI